MHHLLRARAQKLLQLYQQQLLLFLQSFVLLFQLVWKRLFSMYEHHVLQQKIYFCIGREALKRLGGKSADVATKKAVVSDFPDDKIM